MRKRLGGLNSGLAQTAGDNGARRRRARPRARWRGTRPRPAQQHAVLHRGVRRRQQRAGHERREPQLAPRALAEHPKDAGEREHDGCNLSEIGSAGGAPNSVAQAKTLTPLSRPAAIQPAARSPAPVARAIQSASQRAKHRQADQRQQESAATADRQARARCARPTARRGHETELRLQREQPQQHAAEPRPPLERARTRRANSARSRKAFWPVNTVDATAGQSSSVSA